MLLKLLQFFNVWSIDEHCTKKYQSLGKRDTTRYIPRTISFSPLHFVLYIGKSITCRLGQCECMYKQPCTVFHGVVRCNLSRKIRKTFFRHLVGYGWTSQSLVGGGPCPSFKPFYYLRCFHSRLWACARSETQNLGPIDDDIYTPRLLKEQLTRQLEGKDNSGLLYDVEVPS